MGMQTQKRRMNHGLRRLLAVLCLAASWQAQAVLDSVPPKGDFPANAPALHGLNQYTGCSLLPSGGTAINDYPSDLFYTVILYGNPSDAQHFIHPGMLSNNCVPRDMGKGAILYGILIVQRAECPDPKLYPTISYNFNYFHRKCEREIPETYELNLTPDQATIEPGKSYTFMAKVISKASDGSNQGSGIPSQPVPVTIKVEVDPTSGGHDHGETVATRPKGTLSTTGGNISFPVTFTATDVSGKHTITATCELCANKTATATATVNVKVEGLKEIPGSQFYTLYETDGTNTGSKKGIHESNHWLTPTAAPKLLILAINYQSQAKFKVLDPTTNVLVTPQTFRVNDASLEWGGRFDRDSNWVKPHSEHTRGMVVDLRANEGTPNTIPPESFPKFDALLKKTLTPDGSGEMSFLECTPDPVAKKGMPLPPQHKRIPANLCISQLDGSFDTNRHYHVRLMGVAK